MPYQCLFRPLLPPATTYQATMKLLRTMLDDSDNDINNKRIKKLDVISCSVDYFKSLFDSRILSDDRYVKTSASVTDIIFLTTELILLILVLVCRLSLLLIVSVVFIVTYLSLLTWLKLTFF